MFHGAGRLLCLGSQPRYELADAIRAVFELMRHMPREPMIDVVGLDEQALRRTAHFTGRP
jgi:hypothetical protein